MPPVGSFRFSSDVSALFGDINLYLDSFADGIPLAALALGTLAEAAVGAKLILDARVPRPPGA